MTLSYKFRINLKRFDRAFFKCGQMQSVLVSPNFPIRASFFGFSLFLLSLSRFLRRYCDVSINSMTESLATLKVKHGTVRPNYLLNGQSLYSFVLFTELRNVTCTTHQEGEESLVTLIVSEYFTSRDVIFRVCFWSSIPIQRAQFFGIRLIA